MQNRITVELRLSRIDGFEQHQSIKSEINDWASEENHKYKRWDGEPGDTNGKAIIEVKKVHDEQIAEEKGQLRQFFRSLENDFDVQTNTSRFTVQEVQS